VATSSIVSAAATWGALVVVGRYLGPGEYAQFMVLWGAFFAVTGVLAGLQQEVTRSVAMATTAATEPTGPTPLLGCSLMGASGAALLVASAPLWGPPVLGEDWVRVSLVLAAGFAVYALANFLTGTLAGMGSWSSYSLSIVLEGLIRAAFVVSVVWLGSSEIAWALALLSGILGWVVLLLVSSAARHTPRQPAADSLGVFLGRSTQAVVAAGCGALAVAGFPVLMSATSDGPLTAEAGVVLAVVVCTRAPLLLLLSFQGPLIRRFVLERHQGLRSLWLPALRAGGLIVGLAALSYVIGPPLMRLVFGSEFDPSPGFVAFAVLGAGLLGGLVITGWLVLVRGHHTAFAVGWLATTCATAGLLEMPLGVESRSALALTLGPVVGVGVHLLALWLDGREAQPLGVRRPPTSSQSDPDLPDERAVD